MNHEYELIGSILRNEDLETAAIGGLAPDDLTEEPAKLLRYIQEFWRKYDKYPSTAVIAEDCQVDLSTLEGEEPVSYYVDKIRFHKRASTLSNAMREANDALILDPSSNQAFDLLTDAMDQCRRLHKAREGIINAFSTEFIDSHLAQYDHRAELAARGEIDGYKTPWKQLDEATWGFHPGELWTFVARMGVGKTWLLMLILKNLLEQKVPMIVVSMEMSASQLAARLFALICNVPSNDIRKGRMGAFVRSSYEDKLREFCGTVPFWIVDSSQVRGVAEIETAIRQTKAKGAIVDGAYLLDKDKNMPMWERVSFTQGSLKQTSHSCECFICGSSQLNRSVKKKHKNAGTDALAFADAIGYDSDQVHGLFQDKKMERDMEMLHRQLKNREDRPISFVTEWDLDNNKFDFLEFFEDEDSDEEQCAGKRASKEDEIKDHGEDHAY